jgi:ABC-type Fe3+-hydroxamate transport system substrate-binding protein
MSFSWESTPRRQISIEALGIATVQLGFTDYDGLKKCIGLMGEVVGGKGEQNSRKYLAYLKAKVKMITEATAEIPDNQKPKVLHLASLFPALNVDGKATIGSGDCGIIRYAKETPEARLKNTIHLGDLCGKI